MKYEWVEDVKGNLGWIRFRTILGDSLASVKRNGRKQAIILVENRTYINDEVWELLELSDDASVGEVKERIEFYLRLKGIV